MVRWCDGAMVAVVRDIVCLKYNWNRDNIWLCVCVCVCVHLCFSMACNPCHFLVLYPYTYITITVRQAVSKSLLFCSGLLHVHNDGYTFCITQQYDFYIAPTFIYLQSTLLKKIITKKKKKTETDYRETYGFQLRFYMMSVTSSIDIFSRNVSSCPLGDMANLTDRRPMYWIKSI